MRKDSLNSFAEGLNLDLNPLTTPNNVLTDCINGAFITFNGDELSLQNDAGNTKILIPNSSPAEYVTLSTGFYPLGIKEYGGILYIVSAKLPTVHYTSILQFNPATQYSSGNIVYQTTPSDDKIFYERKNIISGNLTPELPIESDKHWEVVGNKEDYNNKYGQVEFGSYPSPEASGIKVYEGEDINFNNNVSIIYRWVSTGVGGSCLLDVTSRNTGQYTIEEKYQSSENNGQTWTDVVGYPTRTSTVINLTQCSLPQNWIGIVVDSSTYNTSAEQSIPYSENTFITVNTPTKAGFNYVFISIPQNKTLSVKNAFNIDITSSFSLFGTDDRPTHSLNKVYRKDDMFATDLSTVYYIKIS